MMALNSSTQSENTLRRIPSTRYRRERIVKVLLPNIVAYMNGEKNVPFGSSATAVVGSASPAIFANVTASVAIFAFDAYSAGVHMNVKVYIAPSNAD